MTESLTPSQQIELVARFALNRYVVVRTQNAGVHCGILVARHNGEAILGDSRRIWSWVKRRDTKDISMRGLADGARVTPPMKEEDLIVGVIEVHPCNRTVEANLREFIAWDV